MYNFVEGFVLAEKTRKLHRATVVSHTSFTSYQSEMLFNLYNMIAFNFNHAHTKIILNFPYRVFSKMVHGGVT